LYITVASLAQHCLSDQGKYNTVKPMCPLEQRHDMTEDLC
jgi:hypothetical protein